MTRHLFWRPAVVALLLALAVAALRTSSAPVMARQEATPTTGYSCENATPSAATPAMTDSGMGGMEMGTPMADMGMGTPMAGMEMNMELDQLYIDMMLAHHAGIIAMAQAALPELEDERLREIAQNIIDVQTEERGELRDYREEFYGSPEPAPMDESMMSMMSMMMPGMGTMEEMSLQMDPDAQVALICAAEDTDLAFIDMTIAHHQMAITSSETAVDQATNQEIKDFAQKVIEDQQREIDELSSIREELYGSATPGSGS